MASSTEEVQLQHTLRAVIRAFFYALGLVLKLCDTRQHYLP